MENEFVTYEQALSLKELGFDEPCLMVYNYKKQVILNNKIPYKERTNQPNPYLCVAPLKQQAIMFLLNKCDEDGTETSIEYFGDESGNINRHLLFDTLNSAIQILIEIVKKQII